MDIHGLIGLGVRAKREELGLRQEDAAKRFRDSGLPAWRRSTVAQVEAGTRRPSLGDLMLIAVALDCALADLVPADAPELIDVGTGATMTAAAVKALLSGVSPLDVPDEEIRTPEDPGLSEIAEAVFEGYKALRQSLAEQEQTREQVRLIWRGARRAVSQGDVRRSFLPPTEAEERAAERLGVPPSFLKAAAGALWDRDFEKERDSRAGNGDAPASSLQGRRGHATRAMLAEVRDYLRARDVISAEPPAAGGAHLDVATQQPVVAAIVTSRRGVLITARKDGTPPWGFVTGEVEPGELAEDAAVREVKEETGLEVRFGRVIGERDHPVTGRHMIYLAAQPIRATRVTVADEAELAEVRWASLSEATELLPDMFGPVSDYLARTLVEPRPGRKARGSGDE